MAERDFVVRRKLNEDEIALFRARGIKAATSLFEDGGIQAVTMRNLAKQLGCSATAPYRYFENHEALVATLRASVFARFAEHLNRELLDISEPEERLRRLGRSYVDFALDNPTAYRLMFDLKPPTASCPELITQSRRSFEPLKVVAGDFVSARNLPYGADTFAHLFWAQLHGLVSLSFSNKLNFGLTLEELITAFLESSFFESHAHK